MNIFQNLAMANHPLPPTIVVTPAPVDPVTIDDWQIFVNTSPNGRRIIQLFGLVTNHSHFKPGEKVVLTTSEILSVDCQSRPPVARTQNTVYELHRMNADWAATQMVNSQYVGPAMFASLFAAGPSNLPDKCLICLELLEGDALIRPGQCNHMFHYKCIRQSLAAGNITCPTCRGAMHVDQLVTPIEEDSVLPPTVPIVGLHPEQLTLSVTNKHTHVPQSVCDTAIVIRIEAPPAPSDLHQTYVPIDLVLIIDVSGSMRSERLMCVKQSAQFIIDQLKTGDRIGIVTFHSTADIACGMTQIPENKTKVTNVIDGLKADGSTRIDCGIEAAIRLLVGRRHKNPITRVFLLSDGCQNVGTMTECNVQIDALSRLGFATDTFGYGLQHDTSLMSTISDRAGGQFTFIQEAGEVGLAMATALGNVSSVIATNVILEFCPGDMEIGVELTTMGFDKKNSFKLTIPSICYEQRRECIVSINLPTNTSPSNNWMGFVKITAETNNIVSSIPCFTPPRKDASYSKVNLQVSDQENRMRQIGLMESIVNLDEKDLDGRLALVIACREVVLASEAYVEIADTGDNTKSCPLTQAIIKELTTLHDQLILAKQTASDGTRRDIMRCMTSHVYSAQRQFTTQATVYQGGDYESPYTTVATDRYASALITTGSTTNTQAIVTSLPTIVNMDGSGTQSYDYESPYATDATDRYASASISTVSAANTQSNGTSLPTTIDINDRLQICDYESPYATDATDHYTSASIFTVSATNTQAINTSLPTTVDMDGGAQAYLIDGNPTIPDLHPSLQALVHADGGVPSFFATLNFNNICWRIRLTPPFQLQDGRGQITCELRRNSNEETKNLLILDGLSTADGIAYKVQIPSTTTTPYSANNVIQYAGSLRAGVGGDLEHCSYLFR